MPEETRVMLKVLKAVLRFGAALFGAIAEDTAGMFSWMLRRAYEGVTRRSFAQEAADEAEAQAREVAARDAEEQAQADRVAAMQARTEAAARHEERTLLAERHLAETAALRTELARLAERRDEIARQSRSHDPEIRSSRWRKDEEPEGGAPAMAIA